MNVAGLGTTFLFVCGEYALELKKSHGVVLGLLLPFWEGHVSRLMIVNDLLKLGCEAGMGVYPISRRFKPIQYFIT